MQYREGAGAEGGVSIPLGMCGGEERKRKSENLRNILCALAGPNKAWPHPMHSTALDIRLAKAQRKVVTKAETPFIPLNAESTFIYFCMVIANFCPLIHSI